MTQTWAASCLTLYNWQNRFALGRLITHIFRSWILELPNLPTKWKQFLWADVLLLNSSGNLGCWLWISENTSADICTPHTYKFLSPTYSLLSAEHTRTCTSRYSCSRVCMRGWVKWSPVILIESCFIWQLFSLSAIFLYWPQDWMCLPVLNPHASCNVCFALLRGNLQCLWCDGSSVSLPTDHQTSL